MDEAPRFFFSALKIFLKCLGDVIFLNHVYFANLFFVQGYQILANGALARNVLLSVESIDGGVVHICDSVLGVSALNELLFVSC